jgi:hypothetical protein
VLVLNQMQVMDGVLILNANANGNLHQGSIREFWRNPKGSTSDKTEGLDVEAAAGDEMYIPITIAQPKSRDRNRNQQNLRQSSKFA